jgi:hypothetical protein
MSSVTGTGPNAAMLAGDPWFDGCDFPDHWGACGLNGVIMVTFIQT